MNLGKIPISTTYGKLEWTEKEIPIWFYELINWNFKSLIVWVGSLCFIFGVCVRILIWSLFAIGPEENEELEDPEYVREAEDVNYDNQGHTEHLRFFIRT